MDIFQLYMFDINSWTCACSDGDDLRVIDDLIGMQVSLQQPMESKPETMTFMKEDVIMVDALDQKSEASICYYHSCSLWMCSFTILLSYFAIFSGLCNDPLVSHFLVYFCLHILLFSL